MNTKTLGATMRIFRQALGLTIEEVAKRTHLTVANISQIETGKRKASIEKIAIIARAINIPPLLLFYRSGDNEWMNDQTRAFMELEVNTRVIARHPPDESD